jgi:hypothetical protein
MINRRWIMNKKFRILLVFVLLAGAVFLSACQSEVGGRINKNFADNRQAVDVGGDNNHPSSLIHRCCVSETSGKVCGNFRMGGCDNHDDCGEGTTCETKSLD